MRGIAYVNGTEESPAAELPLPYFDGTAASSLETSLRSYKAIDAWQEDMTMTEAAFGRLQDIIENAGELERRADFAELVDTSFSSALYREMHG